MKNTFRNTSYYGKISASEGPWASEQLSLTYLRFLSVEECVIVQNLTQLQTGCAFVRLLFLVLIVLRGNYYNILRL